MSKLKILLSGMIAGIPRQGGASWAVLQYVLGLHQLGHEVHLLEPMGSKAIQPAGASFLESSNATYFRQVTRAFDLERTATLLNTDTKESIGMSYAELSRLAENCDVLINISGLLRDQALTTVIPMRVYLDLDPAFTQLWHTVQNVDVGFSGHTHYVTIGVSVEKHGCHMPTCGLSWITTLQPIVLSHWPVARAVIHDGLTTLANWRGYGSIESNGEFFGQKAHSLRPFFSLPANTPERFILALSIHQDEHNDLEQLKQNGWHLLDPFSVADSPASFQQFVQGSKAEFGFAKSGYVISRCGWFSDRSICYLASGRPVIAQETGFSDFLPVGDGLFAFETENDVMESIESLNNDYAHHCESARKLAEEYFDSSKILNRLLGRIGAI